MTTEPWPEAFERRVLILAPTRRDSATTGELLASVELTSVVCANLDEIVAAAHQGAAAILIAEEMVADGQPALEQLLTQQPAWSDLPVLVLTRHGGESTGVADAVRKLGNVTLLERPLRVSTLVTAVQAAVRARERQYQIRGYIADRERAEASLLEADRRKDEFLATLGHELRNPLAPLLTGLQLLKLEDFTNARSYRACMVMERQVAHLVRLVDDLLAVSRITRGMVEVRREPLELGAVLRAAIETSRPIIDDAQQTLTVELPDEAIAIFGDSVRLTQVFANLLNNASKYTDGGGRIWLSASKNATHVEVSIRDNGIGILPAQLSAVFDMFMQVDRTDRRAQGGLGIGLTLVRSLVTMHGGSVEARSEGTGRGSEFVVRLPLANTAPMRQTASEPARAFPPQRILVVDDNHDAAETLTLLLRALGASAFLAHSGHDALEKLSIVEPDVVLLDIGMPGLDGYEVARHIRASADYSDVLLIALTGWGQEEDRARADRAGFDHHLVKPPDIDRLRALLIDYAERPRPRHLRVRSL